MENVPLLGLFNYIAAIGFVLFGLYTMITKSNIIRKVIGMVILQTGVILFYISISVKENSVIPIIDSAAAHGHPIDPNLYANPLPHALMLTAIVVGVSTLGVALVLAVSIYRNHDSLEEDVILKSVEAGEEKA